MKNRPPTYEESIIWARERAQTLYETDTAEARHLLVLLHALLRLSDLVEDAFNAGRTSNESFAEWRARVDTYKPRARPRNS